MRFLPGFLSLQVYSYNPKGCVKMLKKARESIKIIIPDTNIDFFHDKKIANALKQVIEKKGVSVKVAYYGSSGKIGILAVPGITVFRLAKPQNRLLLSIDAKHALVEHVPGPIRKIETGIIFEDGSLLAHEIDAMFDELIFL